VEREVVAKIVEEVLEEKLGNYFSSFLADREQEYERIGIIDRLIHLEEENKAQQELMGVRFEAMDKRFEDLIHYMDQRFEAVDKRFEDLIHYMDQRFEAVDKRFEEINRRFTLLTWLISSLFGVIALLITVFKFVA